MRNRLLFSTLFAIFSISISIAQTPTCGTDVHFENYLEQLSETERKEFLDRRHKSFLRGKTSNAKMGTVYTIPVVVHVLHDNCDGNISKEQIEDGIAVLNEDFRRINSDTGSTRALFKPYAADVEIEFQLARIDPNGKCTEGIVRVETPLANNVEMGWNQAHKQISQWPEQKYFNVWLVNSIGETNGSTYIAGYAQFPGSGSWDTYGVVVRNDHWGRIGTARTDGRTATHEIGHALGLLHTFQGSCGSSCGGSGDYMCDTPPVFQATYQCVQSQNTCSNDASGQSPYSTNVVDQIENYMSYDACTNMFSKDQSDYMRSNFVTGGAWQLQNLVSSSNLTATGTASGQSLSPCAPIADYCLFNTTDCEGGSVEFTDLSYNGKGTSRNWSFPGGTPASSSDSVVTVTYANAGVYDVSLTVGNAQGNNTKLTEKVVIIGELDADYDNFQYTEMFENKNIYDSLWRVGDIGRNKWTFTSDAAYSGSNSVKVNNIFNFDEDVTELITPSYNLSEVYLPELFIQVAYAYQTSSSTDALKIYYTKNCGRSWSFVGLYPAFQLQSISNSVSSPWTPADQSEWKQLNINIPNAAKDEVNVRFKFEFTGGDGNNFYMDDFEVTSATGIEELNGRTYSIYPNPTKDQLYIETDGRSVQRIELLSLNGEIVESKTNFNDRIEIQTSNLQNGMYLIRLTDGDGYQSIEKVIVQH